MFNECKVAHMAAFFLNNAPEKRLPHLKLMKLLYLADREFMRRHGRTMSGDYLVSMPHGPVLSMTLNLMDGDVESVSGGWESLISDKENHELALRDVSDNFKFNELSAADKDVLLSVWQDFGAMGKWEIRDWTHDHCAEWEDPKGSSKAISYQRLAQAVGYDVDAANELAFQAKEEQDLEQLFAAL